DIPRERIRIQPALARNWDYYTGTVFELATADNCRLGGGGRYDELARLLGAESDVPAVGFTYYADELLKRIPLERPGRTKAITVVVSADAEIASVRWSQTLRQQGYEVRVALDKSDSAGLVLTVQADGSIEWDGTIYPTAEDLIAHMENR